MAGDWIKMTKDLPDKPEVWSMAGALGIDADSVVGKLLRVWAWFDSHTEDGNALRVTYPLLDRIAGVAGFAEAMAMCGWLEQIGSVLRAPNFDRHNGKTAKKRALTNERVAKSRDPQRKGNAACNAGSVTPSVTKSVTREEKRREEEEQEHTGACAPRDQKPPAGDEQPKSRRKPEQTLRTFRAAGGLLVQTGSDPALDYAESIQLPVEFLRLAAKVFDARYLPTDKRQRDWPAHFRNAVRGNWFKLWWHDGSGWQLTTTGKQAEREIQAQAEQRGAA